MIIAFIYSIQKNNKKSVVDDTINIQDLYLYKTLKNNGNQSTENIDFKLE